MLPDAGQVLHGFFEAFARQTPDAILLQSQHEPEGPQAWSFMGFRARQRVILHGETLWINDEPEAAPSPHALLERLRGMEARTWPHASPDAPLPFAGGWMGYLGYEFHQTLSPSASIPPPTARDFPDLVLCEFEDWVLWDGDALHVLTEDPQQEAAYRQVWQAITEQRAAQAVQETLPTGWEGLDEATRQAYRESFQASLTPAAFEAAVTALKGHIRHGEIYQANLSLQLKKTLAFEPYRLYQTLYRRNPSPFSAFFQWPGGVIVCNSPERLVSQDATGRLETRPIAGTRGRGSDAATDAAISAALLANEKERAEHMMLVDLARNDLGRVCQPGSVAVDELLGLERYSHVTHLVSNVVGQVQPGQDVWDVLQALFPGGTITGCPKIRCMSLLQDYEPVPRGPYTGSLGYIDAGQGGFDFNILIRSLYLQATARPFVYNTAVHVGAGIVADSVGAFEYRECLRKAEAMLGVLWAYEQRTGIEPVLESRWERI